MKKQAHTLAEVLIALGIIGILAALMLPLVNKMRPDSTKVMYIKTYDAIVTAVKSIVSNDAIYPTMDANRDYKRAPLFNTATVKLTDGTEIGGDTKFCQAMALAFNRVGDNQVACSNTYSENNFDPSFTTNNGVDFLINKSIIGADTYQSDIYIDVNGKDKGSNCIYSNNCPNPDRFKFMVSASGTVVPADPMGKAYIKTRSNWKKTDLELIGSVDSSLPNRLLNTRTVEIPDAGTSGLTAPAEAPSTGGGVDKTGGGDDDGDDDPPTYGELTVPCNNYYDWSKCMASSVTITAKDLDQPYNWDDADKKCKAQGMRLPRLNELLMIQYAWRDQKISGIKDGGCYWTDSSDAGRGNPNCYQNAVLSKGWKGQGFSAKGVEPRTTKRPVRCVR